jgi:hypothetical protein
MERGEFIGMANAWRLRRGTNYEHVPFVARGLARFFDYEIVKGRSTAFQSLTHDDFATVSGELFCAAAKLEAWVEDGYCEDWVEDCKVRAARAFWTAVVAQALVGKFRSPAGDEVPPDGSPNTQ